MILEFGSSSLFSLSALIFATSAVVLSLLVLLFVTCLSYRAIRLLLRLNAIFGAPLEWRVVLVAAAEMVLTLVKKK
jgi:hypothetical protein